MEGATTTSARHIPIELVGMIIGFLPMKEAVNSASLVCKQWHRLVQENDSLWSIFFHRDIVELHNPLPCWRPRKEESENDKRDEEHPGVNWKGKCMKAFSHTREPKKGWEWALTHGYLGLARIILPVCLL